MSTIASIIFTFTPLFLRLQHLPDWVYWVISAIFFLIASYRTWSLEHKKLLEETARNTSPNLTGTIDEVYIIDTSTELQDESHLVFHTSLVNEGAKQVGIVRYELNIMVDGHNRAAKFRRALFEFEDVIERFEGGNRKSMPVSVQRPDLATYNDNPLKQGEPRKGWLSFKIGVAAKKVEKATLILIVVDAFNNQHTIEGHPPFRQEMRLIKW